MTQRVSLHYAAVPSQPQQMLEATWFARLPRAKAAAIGRLRAPADRNASLLGVALLAAACAELGLAFDAAALEYPGEGKPRLPNGPDFSISHTAGLVACAVATSGRVGLDIEVFGSVTARVAARMFSAEERACIERGELRASDAWVMKEAVVKLTGRGIGALHAVAVEPARATLEGVEYWLEAIGVPYGYVAWLASDSATRAVSVHAADAAATGPLPMAR